MNWHANIIWIYGYIAQLKGDLKHTAVKHAYLDLLTYKFFLHLKCWRIKFTNNFIYKQIIAKFVLNKKSRKWLFK